MLGQQNFYEDAYVAVTWDWRRTRRQEERDKKRWDLNGNGLFSVKSIYNFLNDGGLRCNVVDFLWKSYCLEKINIFNWLVWKNKILSLENLELRRCNKLSTVTCVMYHSNI